MSATARPGLVPLFAGLLGLLSQGCARTAPLPTETLPMSASGAGVIRAPEFPDDVEWLNTDRPLPLAQLRGKIVLLDFWTYCCINCQHILPELQRLERKYADELVVIGVHSAKFTGEADSDNIRQAILRHGIEHPVINDRDFRIWRSYGARAWPTIVVIGPTGQLLRVESGEITYDQYVPLLDAVIRDAVAKGTLKRGPLKIVRERDTRPRSVLAYPDKLLADEAGGRLFIADSSHHRLIVTDLEGTVLQIIGSGLPGFGDGNYARATFRVPRGLALVGDRLYVADTENHALRVVDLTAETVATVIGTGRKPSRFNQAGQGRGVALHSPWALLAREGWLYVANAGSHQLWRVEPATGRAEPFAGSGREDILDGPRWLPGDGRLGADSQRSAALAQPSGLTTDGTWLYFVDSETSSLRRVGFGDDATVVSLLGQGLFEFGDVDGGRAEARLQHPLDVVWHDGALYIADTYNNKIKRFDLATGRVSGFAGSGEPGALDGPLETARFDEPGGLTVARGRLYVADTNNNAIRVIDPLARQVSTLRLTGPALTPPAVGPAPRRVELRPVVVAPGAGQLRFDLRLPAGHKLNPDAPLTIQLSTTPGFIVTAPQNRVDLPVTEPLALPVTLTAGETTLTVTLDAYWCRADGAGACYFETLTAVAPVIVREGAPSREIPVTVDLPGAPGP